MKKPQIIIVDTSVIMKWLSEEHEENVEQADLLLRRSSEGLVIMKAPDLACYEVGNALLKGKFLHPEHAQVVLSLFYYDLPLEYVAPTHDILQRSYQIAEKSQMTFYDACFIALAEANNAPLLTADKKQKVDSVRIIALADYI